MKLSWLDKKAISFFIVITGFVNIIVITEMLGDERFHFSQYSRIGLSIACLIMGIIIAYSKLRMVGIIKNEKEDTYVK